MNHLTNKDIDAVAQYEKGIKSYFKLGEEKYETLKEHLAQCDMCSRKVKESSELFPDIKLKRKNTWLKYSSAAAVLIVFFIYSLQSSSMNEEHFLTYHDFGFMVKRGNNQDSLREEYSKLLLKENYDQVIEDCESKKWTENNLHYIAALVFKAQENDDIDLIYLGLSQFKGDSLMVYKNRIKKLLEKE